MQLSYYYDRVNKAEKEIADLQKKLADETKKELEKQKSISSVQGSINKYTTPSSLQSKSRQIQGYQSDILRIQTTKADIQKKIAAKSTEISKHKLDLNKAEQDDRKKTQKAQEDFQRKMKLEMDSQNSAIDRLVRPVELPNYQLASHAKNYDFFISHASEDKEDLVRKLAEKLTEAGCTVWYDESQLRVGDSLRRKIDEGLRQSKFGIVVLSLHFFQKNWPQYELDGMVAREMNGVKVILPIWHKVSKDEVLNYSPTLADKIALNTMTQSIDEIVKALKELIE